jgi:hypothetical protein
MLAIRSLIDLSRGKTDEVKGEILVLENHFNEAIEL